MFSTRRNMISSLVSVCAVIYAVVHYNSIRQRTKLTRTAILIPAASPWKYIWDNADDASFLELTGFSRHFFNLLLQVLYPDPIAQVFGRPRLLELGLYLFYVNSTMTQNNLCIIFGITPTRCSSIVNKMMKLVYMILKNNVVARVHFPKTYAEKQNYARLVQIREPRVKDVRIH